MSGHSSYSDSSSSTSDILRAAEFSRPSGSLSPEQAPTANDLLMAAYDPARLHPLAGLGDKLDYLLLDDDKTNELPGADTAIPSRGWSDDLCYGTGTMYLSGALDLFQITQFAFCSFRFGLCLFPALLSPYLAILPVLYLAFLLL
jgi:import inner membrane translocase subunit TIM23